jgi:hypothetical protein
MLAKKASMRAAEHFALHQPVERIMRAIVLRGIVWPAIVALLAAGIGFSAAALAADEIVAAQDVIRSQEQAFSRDDAATAYSFAAPEIKRIFPDADIFMSVVQSGYAPVYRHKSFEFGAARVEGNWVAQRVHIIDEDGQTWEALYTLEQQADGSFKITGCTLLKAGDSV